MIAYRCEFTEGDLIDNKYRVEKRLGVGSYGTVYRVRLGVNVYALKLLRLWEVSANLHDELIKRFNLEYSVSKNDSDYFVHSYEYGEVNGNPYYIMEYCSQGDLSSLNKNAKSNINRIAHDILMGLYDLHSTGLVHRDLKPENVMIRDNGSAALTDFGIVGDKKKRLTQKNWLSRRPRQVFGTYLYMSPEQADRKGGGITYLPTTDIFSFGVMMYELLTDGKFPFGVIESYDDLNDYQDKAKRGIWDKRPLYNANDGYTWLKIIEKCIKPDYRERYQSVTDILIDMPQYSAINIPRNAETGDVIALVITLGDEIGKKYTLKHILPHNRKMIRIGRDASNDITLNEGDTSYISRFHATLELDKNDKTWYIRDGQWRIDSKKWVASTNGTYLGNIAIPIERTEIKVGDIITIGDLKMLVKS